MIFANITKRVKYILGSLTKHRIYCRALNPLAGVGGGYPKRLPLIGDPLTDGAINQR